VKTLAEFKRLRMHVDGVQKIEAVDGARIECRADETLAGKTLIESLRYQQNAPTKSSTAE
jgi:hypothetical protein